MLCKKVALSLMFEYENTFLTLRFYPQWTVAFAFGLVLFLH